MIMNLTIVATPRALVARAQQAREVTRAPRPRASPASATLVGRSSSSLLDPDRTSIGPLLGLDPSEGVFGFKPFSELLVGRLAMLGFATGVIDEVITGQPILQQIGVPSPSTHVFEILLVVMGGAVLIAAADTLIRLETGALPETDVERYRHFAAHPLGEDELETPTTSGSVPLAAFSLNGEGQDSPDAPEPIALQWISDMDIAAIEAKQARDQEIANGRWAMIGFASAILIEAATGTGVIGQGAYYARVFGLIGPPT